MTTMNCRSTLGIVELRELGYLVAQPLEMHDRESNAIKYMWIRSDFVASSAMQGK